MSAVTNFWIAAGILMGLVIGLLCWPLLRRGKETVSDRAAINAAIYRDEMAELLKDKETGELSEQDYQTAKEELERRVLEDTAADAAGVETAPVSRKFPRTALVLLVAIPLLALPLYLLFGNPDALVAQKDERKMTRQDVEGMVSKLAARLEQNPNNPEGWLMLARSYKALGRFDEAEKAYDKLGNMKDGDSNLILERVELAVYRNDGKIDAKTQAALNGVLKKEPDHPEGLMLAGTVAFAGGNYKIAIGHWERLRKLFPADSEDAKYVSEGINAARAKLGEKPGAATGR